MREMLQQAVDSPNANVELLGKRKLDGREVIGFRFKMGHRPMTLWADPKTRLPARIETTMAGPPQVEVVMSNYEFNVDLDKSMFSTAVPEGYEVIQADMEASLPTEKDFLVALRLCSEKMQSFPPGFDAAAVAGYVASYLVKQGYGKDKDLTSAQMSELLKVGRGLQFALTLPAESDAHYAGTGAKLGDAKRAIFWYKPVGAEKYRVIYADLSLKESTEPPKAPNAKKLAR